MEHKTSRREFLRLMAGLGATLAGGTVVRAAEATQQGEIPGCLRIVSACAERPHLVAPGGVTSFVVAVTNPGPTRATARLSIETASEGWAACASEADSLFRALGEGAEEVDLELDGHERRFFVVVVRPDQELAEGCRGTAKVRLDIDRQPAGSVTVQGKVRTTPKVYFVVYDGLGRDYALLDRRGEYEDVATEPLMPHLRAFMGDSACMLGARSQVPSITDSNHTSVLTGSWPGTSGAISNCTYYCGLDEQGQPVTMPANPGILRWGSDGDPVRSIFHLAKDPEMGGDPEATNAMILGKAWVGAYFSDDENTVDILANGHRYPGYLPAPDTYVLGDPESDEDADTDRDGWNLNPPALFRKIPHPPIGTSGDDPSHYPSDRWILEGALRIIAAEDPDVLYILPGNVDTAQHHTGAADQPGEWNHGTDPDVLWDDFNEYHLHANRDPGLDVVHEADALFGLLVRALRARGSYDDSMLVLTADHGQCTYLDEYLSVRQIALDAGIPEEAFAWISSVGEVAFLWLSDPLYAEAVECALEDFSVGHPVLGQEVHPLLVLSQTEMDTGVDGIVGRIAADGGPKRGELYSEWCIDHPVDDHSKPVWPDLIVFSRFRYQIEYTKPSTHQVGGHGGVGWQQRIPLAIRGPGINKGFYDQNPAFPVDIAPTLYRLLGCETPAHVDGRVLTEILAAE